MRVNSAGHDRPVVLITVYDWDSAVGVRRLYETLRQDGHPVKVIQFGISHRSRNQEEDLFLQGIEYDTPTYYPPAEPEHLRLLGELLRRLDPILVGVSVLSTAYHTCLQVTKVAKESTNATILWGGVHPTFEPEGSLADSGADAVCVGEGELVILDVVRKLRSGDSDLTGVPNLCLRGEDGKLIRNPVRPLIKDLNEIGFHPYRPEDQFMVPPDLRERAAQEALSEDLEHFTPRTVMTGFGCPYKCTFCFNEPMADLYRGKGRYVRRMSVARVMNECRHARDVLGKRFIAFWDDIFSLDRAWLEEFAAVYPKEVGLPYFCYFHPKHTDEAFVDLIVKSGCVSAICGVQSGSESFRAGMYHRYETNAQILQTGLVLNHRVAMTYDIIVDTPHESEADWRANVELFLRMPHPFRIATNSFILLPGCSITDRLLKEGIVKEEELTWRQAGYDPSNYFQDRRTVRQLNYYMLMIATQHVEFERDAIRSWMDDDRLLDDPVAIRERIATGLYKKVRVLYLRERSDRQRLERELAARQREPEQRKARPTAPGMRPRADLLSRLFGGS